MLRRIDVAVFTPKVTASEYMEEYVRRIFLKGHRLFHQNLQSPCFSETLCVIITKASNKQDFEERAWKDLPMSF
jgi:hypothetical protein